MKKENWDNVRTYLDDIDIDLDDLESDDITKATAISNIRGLAADIYTICEDDYCDSCIEGAPDEYDEIIAMLPNTKLSLAEMLSLKETIQRWRDEHGYPNP